ncbi:restriction endonuclease subunit S [Pectobacterium aroidearum]|uniref:restriction endonuclease subunit S n=1 Tax=Pectobacterium aroidearum TaxID=1201031 RepID=UPI0032EF0E7A
MAVLNKYKAYPEYKDSGVEWLGEIPSSWDMWKLSHAYEAIGSGTTPTSSNESLFQGDIPWVTTGELRENVIYDTAKKITASTLQTFSALKMHPAGSVVIAMYGATIGRLGILGVDATTNQACCVMTKSNIISNQYLYYWLQTFREDIIRLSSGGGQPNINQEKVACLKVSAPGWSDQATIVSFLDHETAKIDDLIEKQQQLIELLKEKRQAVISHAVTKGLNPNALMKNSGVEWLGEVPEHWVCTALKHMANIIDCKHITAEFSDTGIPVASIGEVKNWFVDLSTAKLTNEKYYHALIDGGRTPVVGDIIYSRNATVGEAAIVGDGMPKFAMGQDVCLIKAKEEIIPEFILYILKSKVIIQQLSLAMIGSTFKRINVDDIRSFSITIPPKDEQVLIVNILVEKLDKYDRIITNAEIVTHYLKERRTALISAAVTGKIDVRDWVAPDSSEMANIEESPEVNA